MKVLLHLFLLIALTSLSTMAQQAKIEALLEEYFQEGKLNGNVLVMRKGEVLLEVTYGYANGNRTIPLTHDHQFIIGSVYK